MKKIFTLVLTCILVLALSTSAYSAASPEQSVLLSELSEDACIEFIISAGLEIPAELVDYSSLGAFVKNVVTTVENDPNHIV